MVQSISRSLLQKSRYLQCDVYVGEPVFGLRVSFRWHNPSAACRCREVPPACSLATQLVFSIYPTFTICEGDIRITDEKNFPALSLPDCYFGPRGRRAPESSIRY